MYYYCSNCAFMHIFTSIDVSIFFFNKMCKMKGFLHFARLCTHWCGCCKWWIMCKWQTTNHNLLCKIVVKKVVTFYVTRVILTHFSSFFFSFFFPWKYYALKKVWVYHFVSLSLMGWFGFGVFSYFIIS